MTKGTHACTGGMERGGSDAGIARSATQLPPGSTITAAFCPCLLPPTPASARRSVRRRDGVLHVPHHPGARDVCKAAGAARRGGGHAGPGRGCVRGSSARGGCMRACQRARTQRIWRRRRGTGSAAGRTRGCNRVGSHHAGAPGARSSLPVCTTRPSAYAQLSSNCIPLRPLPRAHMQASPRRRGWAARCWRRRSWTAWSSRCPRRSTT